MKGICTVSPDTDIPWSKLLEGKYDIEDQSVILPRAAEMEVKITFKNYVTRILMYNH